MAMAVRGEGAFRAKMPACQLGRGLPSRWRGNACSRQTIESPKGLVSGLYQGRR